MALLLKTYKSSVDNPFAVEPPENAENPSLYNDEDPSNPPHQYKINLDLGELAKRFERYKQDNQWYKVQK